MQVVVGLGASGISSIRHLLASGLSVVGMDSSANPKNIDQLKKAFPKVKFILGSLDPNSIQQAEQLIVSPGVPLQQAIFAEAQQKHIPIIGDIELFARATQKPIYAITGSNGKTTVTTLLGLMADEAGFKYAVAGNIGRPVLDLLTEDHAGYILELSSFQLETTYSLNAAAAVILNVSPDHMDRYASLDDYRAAKCRIYNNCQTAIINQDAPELWPRQEKQISFSVQSKDADYYLADSFLMHHEQTLLAIDDMPLQGLHHFQNALAALAMADSMGIPMAARITVLKKFTGLAHRCQLVRTKNQVAWYNDSKATNVGATITALKTLYPITKGKVILIAGGQAKNADFSDLYLAVQQYVDFMILFGEDKHMMFKVLQSATKTSCVTDLHEAVQQADELANPADCVVLSPACASFDMFKNYIDRGECFMREVKAL